MEIKLKEVWEKYKDCSEEIQGTVLLNMLTYHHNSLDKSIGIIKETTKSMQEIAKVLGSNDEVDAEVISQLVSICTLGKVVLQDMSSQAYILKNVYKSIGYPDTSEKIEGLENSIDRIIEKLNTLFKTLNEKFSTDLDKEKN